MIVGNHRSRCYLLILLLMSTTGRSQELTLRDPGEVNWVKGRMKIYRT